MVLFSAALHGSLPAPIPDKELKLLCPPPGKSCLYCVLHNLISFFLVLILFLFIIKVNIFIFSSTLSHNILDRIFVNTGSVVPQAPLSPRKVLYLIKRCYCFALSVYFFSSSFPLLPRKQIYFLSCFYRVRLV